MINKTTVYLDNAATSFPKPPSVINEVYRCMSEYCGNPGRGGHSLSLAAARKVYECRSELCELFGAVDPMSVVFTQNTTHAINLVIKGLLKAGDHVIISDAEHNSVFRPIAALAKKGIIEYSIFPSGLSEDARKRHVASSAIARRMKKNTRAVICSHASNICSLSLPIAEIGEFCRRNGLLFIVDAAQSAGHLHIDVSAMNIDALCIPSHKALYGPQGGGAAILSPSISSSLQTLTEGGGGINSLDEDMPDTSPERYEAGTLATPVIAGLCEGVKLVRSIGIETIHAHECSLYRRARELLMNIKGVSVYAPECEGSVILFNKDGCSPELVAQRLDESGICVRAGYHCAPLAHKALGTVEHGAVRASFGIFNKYDDVEMLAEVIKRI